MRILGHRDGGRCVPDSIGLAHLVFHALGQLFNLLRLLDHVHRQDVGTGAIDILFEFSGQAEEPFGVAAKRQLPFAKSIGDLRPLKLLGKIDSRVHDRDGLNLRATSLYWELREIRRDRLRLRLNKGRAKHQCQR